MVVLDHLVGPLLIGITLSVLFYGIMIVQTFTYYRLCWRDPRWIKCMVAFLFIADTLNVGFMVVYLYQSVVTDWGDFEGAVRIRWTGNTDPFITSIVSSVVQLFYAHWVLRLTNNKWVTAFIATMSLIQCSGGIAAMVHLGHAQASVGAQTLRNEMIIWMTFAMVTDITITITLVRFLRDNRTGYATTDDLLSKITRTVIQTGLMTTIWASLSLILYLAIPNTIGLIFNLPLCKLYTNTLMSSLNARARRGSTPRRSQTTAQVDQTMSSVRFRPPPGAQTTNMTESAAV